MAEPPQKSGHREHKHQRHFDTAHLQSQLKRRSVRSGAVTMLSQVATFLLGIVYLATLGRLLTPGEFGVIDSIIPFTGIALLLMDLGLAMATIQRAEVNQGQISTLFWANVGLSTVIAVMIVAAAPLVANFYDNPDVMKPMMAYGAVALMSGLGIQHLALLRRQMRFKAVAQIVVVSNAIGIVSAIISALLGASYWSLVIMRIASAASATIGAWILCDWRPGLPVRRSGVRSMLSFGTNLASTNVLNYLSRNVDTLLLAWKYGTESVGFYQRAYRLVLMPMHKLGGPVTTVAIPTLSRLQDQPQRYRAFYRQGLMVLVTLSMPVVAFCFAVADTMILAVLGDQWSEAVPIFRALGPAAFMATTNVATGWVYISLGHTKRQFRFSILVTVLTISAFAFGLPWEAFGVALAFSICTVALRLPALLYCFHGTPIGLSDYFVATWRAASASVIAGAGVWVFQTYVVGAHPVVELFLDALVFGILFIVYLAALPGGVVYLKRIIELARELRGAKQKNAGLESELEAGDRP